MNCSGLPYASDSLKTMMSATPRAQLSDIFATSRKTSKYSWGEANDFRSVGWPVESSVKKNYTCEGEGNSPGK